ncbi:MAG: tetratricopeptide repeat protein [Bacteroidota bacterium]
MKTPIKIRKPKIRIFNPGRLSDEELEAVFLVRHEVFQDIFQEIIDSPSIAQHHLIVGQRGMGKTTLLCRLAAELRKITYADKLLPIEFPEEQYIEVDRLSRFWLNCLDGVADALEERNLKREARELDQKIHELDRLCEKEEELAVKTQKLFKHMIDTTSHRFVLLIDNFNLLLKKFKKNEDYVLRGFFSERNAPILIGGSVVVPEMTTDYDAAFYDAFKTHILHRLTLDEMHQMLIRLSREAGKKELALRIQEESARLKVLRDLTGGNPRTTMLLFKLFTEGFSEDAWEDLESLLDDVTPLYQSRLDQLSDQGQLIVGVLAREWSPATRATLLERTRIPSGSLSPQILRLEELGIVEKVPLASVKQAGYQIAERFLNIWYLMRFAARRQRNSLIYLTKFLQTFYEPEELCRRARELTNRDFLPDSGITHAMALAEAEGLSDRQRRELRYHAELSLGLKDNVEMGSFDSSEISKEAKDHAALWKKLEKKIPVESGLNAKLFAKLVLGSFSLFSLEGSYESIVQAKLSHKQLGELIAWLELEVVSIREVIGDLTFRRLQRQLWLGRIQPQKNAHIKWKDIEALLEKESISIKNLERVLRLFVELDPEFNLSWNALGSVLSEDKTRLKEAKDAFLKAIELDDQDAVPWNSYGFSLAENFDCLDEAEKAFRKAIELDPDYDLPWANLMWFLSDKLGLHEKAEAVGKEAVDLGIKSAKVFNNLGFLLSTKLDRYKEAETAYRNAIRYDSNNPAFYNNLGWVLSKKLGNHQDGIRELHKALEINPKYELACSNLLNGLEDSGSYDEAVDVCKKFLDQNPDSAVIWNGLGVINYNHLNSYKEAKKYFEKATEIDSSDGLYWRNLAKVQFFKLGKFQEARRAYQKACELEPEETTQWIQLGNLHLYKFAEPSEAKKCYNKAIHLGDKDIHSMHSLVFILCHIEEDYKEGERILASLKEEGGYFMQSMALQKMLLSSKDNNWGKAKNFLIEALEESEGEFSSVVRDHWYFASSILLHQGYGEKLVLSLKEKGWDLKLMPWYEALNAHLKGGYKYLQDIPEEAREVAGLIFERIADMRKCLPDSTKNIS